MEPANLSKNWSEIKYSILNRTNADVKLWMRIVSLLVMSFISEVNKAKPKEKE